ncbi:hypothetical protein BDK51DRAFT_35419 [Blyttiomyces helicus]|uniref:HIG1 domain-containing protein n=1 Tax=Blyttiomyces helicus TaxID=388810 RepID=A0A4P9WLP7_9FUNG|nr:hypothetical protein BDK51DRAFT_35419 [Blyttiomyces helicus]|eukprot:RKO93804.1 hypothetical protein BDK51DRAFT_35419 [Blyttiomyces helicus]
MSDPIMPSPAQLDPYHVTKEEKEARNSYVLREGVKATLIAVPFIAAGHFAATKYVSLYRGLTPQFKLFITMMVPTGVFFTATDGAAIRADRAIAARFSVTRAEVAPIKVQAPFSWSLASIRDVIIDHKYPIIGYGWTAAVAATLLYNYRRGDISRSQKIINARMVAQSFALIGMGSIAAAQALSDEEDHEIEDPHFQSIIKAKAQ